MFGVVGTLTWRWVEHTLVAAVVEGNTLLHLVARIADTGHTVVVVVVVVAGGSRAVVIVVRTWHTGRIAVVHLADH